MKLTLEDWTPYEESVLWRIHDAYFARRGAAAWTDGDIPFFATSNYAIARQHARTFLAHVRAREEAGVLDAREPLHVLEVGSGLGRFAENFLLALARGTGAEGRAVLERLRYVLSDYSTVSLEGALRSPALAAARDAGRLLPARLDLRRPRELALLSGGSLEGPLDAVFASYVACALPPRVVKKKGEQYAARHVRVSVDVDDSEGARPDAAKEWLARALEAPTRAEMMKSLELDFVWRPAPLERVVPEAAPRAAVAATLAPFEEASVVCPAPFLEFIRAVRPAARRGALILVNDFGSGSARDLEGRGDRPPLRYGNSLSHELNFSIFDAFCRQEDLGLIRTHRTGLAIHTAAILYSPSVPRSFARAFRSSYVRAPESQDLLDFQSAAFANLAAGNAQSAARLFERCHRLEPLAPEHLRRAGEACLQFGQARRALAWFRKGQRLDARREHDFDFNLGRAYAALDRHEKAKEHFERALELEAHPVTLANLGAALERLGDFRGAYRAYQRSLSGQPDGELANGIRRKICEQYLPAGEDVGTVVPE